MQIRPSSALRNDYNAISELAKKTGEPVFITNKGEGDGVFMSVEAFEEREKMFRHRDAIYAAEFSRCNLAVGAARVHSALHGGQGEAVGRGIGRGAGRCGEHHHKQREGQTNRVLFHLNLI